MSISESMNTSRSKSGAASVVTIEDASGSKAPYLAFGFLSVLYGTSIFIFLPMALLQFNLGLLLFIFFMILFGMILGLSMLATNI
jgi:hypothetical protein